MPTGGRAESAPELTVFDVEVDGYFLGTIQEESPKGILKMYKRIDEKGDEEVERASCLIRDALGFGNAADSAARVLRRKGVKCSPLVSLYT